MEHKILHPEVGERWAEVTARGRRSKWIVWMGVTRLRTDTSGGLLSAK